MPLPTVDERVAAGAAWLDEQMPGWRLAAAKRLDDLDMSATSTDVRALALGHAITVDYFDVEALAEQYTLGFMAHSEESWEELTEAWRKQLT